VEKQEDLMVSDAVTRSCFCLSFGVDFEACYWSTLRICVCVCVCVC